LVIHDCVVQEIHSSDPASIFSSAFDTPQPCRQVQLVLEAADYQIPVQDQENGVDCEEKFEGGDYDHQAGSYLDLVVRRRRCRHNNQNNLKK
jgi:hypothetical protein